MDVRNEALRDEDVPSSDNDANARAILSIVEGVTVLERPNTTKAALRLLPALLNDGTVVET